MNRAVSLRRLPASGPHRRWSVLLAWSCTASGAWIVAACGSNAPPPPPPTTAPRVVTSASVSASASARPIETFTEADFTESDNNRDPFRVYKDAVKVTSETRLTPQYQVTLDRYGIEELKLVAIVSASDGVRAMFVDPQGKGWVVQRGTHLGRGEMVKLGAGGSSYLLHWKVDRIKPSEVVLVREDTLHPEVPPAYREIPLHVEGEKT